MVDRNDIHEISTFNAQRKKLTRGQHFGLGLGLGLGLRVRVRVRVSISLISVISIQGT
jgi:hypothetical protein